MSFEKNLRRLARRLSHSDNSVPPGLRARVLENLPEREPGDASVKGSSKMTRRILLTAAVASVATAGALIGPRYLLTPSFAAADVHSAILKANTWHFTGWRIREEKKVRWEIWGRRAPFFYREQIGDEVLIDDGKARTHFVPGRSDNGQSGFVLVRKSDRNAATFSDARAGFLAGVNGDATLRQVSRTAALESTNVLLGPREITETTRLEIDPGTKLPRAYQVKNTEKGVTTVHAELDPEYDVTLPGDLPRPAWPTGTPVADMTVRSTAPEAQGKNASSQGGLTIAASALAQDAQGTIRLGYKTWFGETLYNGYNIPVGLGIPSGVDVAAPTAKDDRGNRYVFVQAGEDRLGEIYLTPLEPLAPGAVRPKKLFLDLPVTLDTFEKIDLGKIGSTNRAIPIVKARLSVEVDLPEEVSDLDWDNPKNFSKYWTGWHPSYRGGLAVARAQGYGSQNQAPDRQAYWYTQAAKAARDVKGGESMVLMFLKNAESLKKR